MSSIPMTAHVEARMWVSAGSSSTSLNVRQRYEVSIKASDAAKLASRLLAVPKSFSLNNIPAFRNKVFGLVC